LSILGHDPQLRDLPRRKKMKNSSKLAPEKLFAEAEKKEKPVKNRRPEVFVSSFREFPAAFLKALLTPSSIVFLPVLIVYTAIGNVAEGLFILGAYLLYMLVMSFLGRMAENTYKLIDEKYKCDVKPAKHNDRAKHLGSFAAFCSGGTIFLLAVSAIILVIFLISGKKGFEYVLYIFLTSVLLSITVSGPQNLNPLYVISAAKAYALAFPKDADGLPAVFTSESSSEILSDAGGVAILSEEVLYDKRICVRRVWASGTAYEGEELGKSALRQAAEKAMLISSGYLNSVELYPAYVIRNADALNDFAYTLVDDPSVLLSDISDLHQINNHPGIEAVTLRITGMSDLAGTTVLSGLPGSNFGLCNAFRASDGRVLAITDDVKSSLAAFFKKCSELCLSPFIIFSNVNTHGRLSGDTILEAAFAIGGAFPGALRDVDAALTEFGIKSTLALKGTDRFALSFGVNSGFVKERQDVSIAGRDDNKSEGVLKSPRVYLGGDPSDSVANINNAVLAGYPEDCEAIPDLPYVGILSNKDEGSDAVALIPEADSGKDRGGLASLFELITSASEIGIKRLIGIFLLCSSAAAYLVSFLLPVITGLDNAAPSPFGIIISQLVSVLIILSGLISDRPILRQTLPGLFEVSYPSVCLYGLLAGAVTGIAISPASLLCSKAGGCVAFSAYILTVCASLIAVRITTDIHFGYDGFDPLYAVMIVVSLFISFVIPYFFHTGMGIAKPDAVLLIKALAASLIPAAVSFGTAFGASWLLFPKIGALLRKKKRGEKS